MFPPRVVVSWWTVSTITSTAAAAETRATVGRIASAPPQSRHKHPRNARQITPDYLRECIVERRPNRRWVSVFENGPLVSYVDYLQNFVLSLRRRIPQIWGIQSPETSEILNAHSNYKLSHLTYAHVFTNTRPRDCAITRVQRQRTSPSTQRFPNSKAYIHRVLQVFHSVFKGFLSTNPPKFLGL